MLKINNYYSVPPIITLVLYVSVPTLMLLYTLTLKPFTVYAEISAVCKFRGFHGHFLDSENLIHGNLSVCSNSAVFAEHVFRE